MNVCVRLKQRWWVLVCMSQVFLCGLHKYDRPLKFNVLASFFLMVLDPGSALELELGDPVMLELELGDPLATGWAALK